MKWTILQLFGWLFLLLSISTIYFALTVTSVDNLFWLSNWALALIGIGLIFKLPRLIASQLNIILIPHLFWTIDFVYILLFRQPLWGITDYFFETTHLLLNIASLSHVLLYPVGLYALFVYGLQSTDFWRISFLQISLIYILTFFFTDPANNINCVFESCLPVTAPESIYGISWFLLFLNIIFITHFLLSFFFVAASSKK